MNEHFLRKEEMGMTGLDPISWAIILLLIGCGLVVMEVFIPSGGLLSLLSGLALLASLVMAFRSDTTTGLTFLLITLIAVPSTVGLAFKVWPLTPMGKAFLGELPTSAEMTPEDSRRELVGRVGIAKSKMLPAGSVMVDGKYVDAISQGGAIDLGQAVVVIEVRGNRVVVRAADDDEARQIAADPRDVFTKPIEELGLESFDDPLA
ncbi:MAG: hypothetical protein MI725_03195 [Pirellulales bacterium]|nr:hypothetical protein [Pirellulales bacterium]